MVTHKKYVSLLSLLLLGSSMNLNAQSYEETKLMVALTAAAAATVGVAWYACKPYSSQELVRKTEDIEAKFYAILEKFNFPNASSDFQRVSDLQRQFDIADEVERMGKKESAHCWDIFLSSLNESDLGKYAGISGIVNGTFHSACTQLIDEISYLESKFPKTIQREKDPEIKLCLQENLIDLETIHYGFLFLDKLFTYHKPYFELHELSKKLRLQYTQELTAIFYSNEHVRSLYTLKRTQQLSADIKTLQTLLSDTASRRYSSLRAEAENLLYDLICIHRQMIADPRYALDLYNEKLAEQLRLERLRNQLLLYNAYYYQAPTRVHVDIHYTTDTTPAKNIKPQETPVAPKPTQTPPSETKIDKPATLETSSTSIFDYSHGAADL